jgi:hypothetical protein
MKFFNSCGIIVILTILCVIFNRCSKDKETNNPDYYGQGPISNGDYYVATWGNDTNPGTFNKPWGTWQKAFETAKAGDVVYFRGGIWYPTSFVVYDGTFSGNSGTFSNPICFYNYPGEIPILDLSKYNYTIDAAGLDIRNVTYVKFSGLTVRNNKQDVKGQWISGLQFYHCGNLWVDRMTSYGHGGYGIWFSGYDTLYLTNCDSYNNIDNISTDPGNRADGFQISSGGTSSDAYKITYISGCRAWGNSDDGIEISTSKQLEVSNCWSFDNGRLEYGAGVGFKFGPSSEKTAHKRKIHNTIAAFNRGPGYADQNLTDVYDGPVGEFSNNTAYKCKIGFSSDPNIFDCNTGLGLVVYRNNLVYQSTYSAYLDQVYFTACNYNYPTYTIQNHNTWIPTSESPYWAYNDTVKVTDDDFVSLDTAQLRWPRNSDDGSLPDIDFLKLAKGSDLIDKGVNVGLPFEGKNPDLGAFEVE